MSTVLLLIAGLWFCTLGLRGLIGTHPLILPSWVQIGVACCAMAPLWVDAAGSIVRPWRVEDVVLVAGLLLLVVAIGTVWYDERAGITFYGVTETAFREAYRRALDELTCVYDEWPTKLKFPLDGYEIQMRFGDGVAAVSLTARPTTGYAPMRELAGHIQRVYCGESRIQRRGPHIVNLCVGISSFVFLAVW